MFGTENGRKRVAVVSAGFNDSSGKPLGNFDRFRHAAAFTYQAWNVHTRPQKAATSDLASANSDRHFLDRSDVLSHCRI
jgi:hypothetical protein